MLSWDLLFSYIFSTFCLVLLLPLSVTLTSLVFSRNPLPLSSSICPSSRSSTTKKAQNKIPQEPISELAHQGWLYLGMNLFPKWHLFCWKNSTLCLHFGSRITPSFSNGPVHKLFWLPSAHSMNAQYVGHLSCTNLCPTNPALFLSRCGCPYLFWNRDCI